MPTDERTTGAVPRSAGSGLALHRVRCVAAADGERVGEQPVSPPDSPAVSARAIGRQLLRSHVSSSPPVLRCSHADGSLDRAAPGRRVFADPEAVRHEAIAHPMVRRADREPDLAEALVFTRLDLAARRCRLADGPAWLLTGWWA